MCLSGSWYTVLFIRQWKHMFVRWWIHNVYYVVGMDISQTVGIYIYQTVDNDVHLAVVHMFVKH